MTVAATISVDEAAARTWGAVVVGAGPAGAVAARELARRGVAVLLVDKATFPRAKVCGCCLNGAALDLLAAIGLGDLPRRSGAVALQRVTLAAGGRTADVRLPTGVALSREAFDAALIKEAIAEGAAFLPGAVAKRTSSELTLGSLSVQSCIVIAADGLNGRLTGTDATPHAASRIGAGVVLDGAPDFFLNGSIFMAVARGGYVGLVRVEDGRLDVAAAFDPTFVRDAGGLGAAAVTVLREAGFPAIASLDSAAWRGTPALTRTARHVAGDRWFAVGDAAGYVEPFTGEGMAWAIASGTAVAPIAARAAEAWSDSLSREWEATHARLVRSRQTVCRAAAWVLRLPRLSRLAVRALAVMPALSRPVVGALNRPGARS